MPLKVPLGCNKTNAHPPLVCGGDGDASAGATDFFLVHAEARLGGFGGHPTHSPILKSRIFITMRSGRFECIPIVHRNDLKRLVT
jgi:hypothetical protein